MSAGPYGHALGHRRKAQSLGLTFPERLLVTADEVIP
jgi:hypothetical protein